MATGITFGFRNGTYTIALTDKTEIEDLKRSCASKIGLLHWQDVVGFASGQVVYPPSYVTKFGLNGMFSNKILRLIVRNIFQKTSDEDSQNSHHDENDENDDENDDENEENEENEQESFEFEFDIGNESEYTVQMKEEDLKTFQLVKERSRLCDFDLKKLYSCFHEKIQNSKISKNSKNLKNLKNSKTCKKTRLSKNVFDLCIRELIPGERLSLREKRVFIVWFK